MESDRRTSTRMPATIAVEIDGQSRKGRLGVTRDASQTGLLMATPSRFDIGEELDLKLYVGHDIKHVRGRVARIETNPPRSTEMWRYKLAIQLIEPLAAPLARVQPS